METLEIRQKERVQKRKNIQDAARIVFSKRGFRNATINDITKEALLSQGTLYLYFDSKNELFTSLSMNLLKHMIAEMKSVTHENQLTTEEQWSYLIKILIRIYESDTGGLLNLFRLQSAEALKNLSTETIKQVKDLSTQFMAVIVEIVKKAMNEKIFSKGSPVAIADIIWSVFEGIILVSESKSHSGNKKDYVKKTLHKSIPSPLNNHFLIMNTS